jgi:uncharacterized protein (TIGR02996 family)
MPSADERAFFDRIRDEPSDDAPRLIFADWLDENGEPERAEFIRIQCALDQLLVDDPLRDGLQKRESELLDANRERWQAALVPFVVDSDFRHGVIDRVSVDTGRFLADGGEIFDLAPIRRVRFMNIGDRLVDLVQSPLLRQVRELDLTNNNLGNRIPILLARSSHLTQLEALDLGFTDLGDKGLQVLASSPVFASLRSLQINDNGHLGLPGMRAIADSPHLTSLKELDVSNNSLSAVALQPILDGPPANRLFRLILTENRLGDAGVAALVASPVFARMAERDRVIDLRRVEMGPAGARSLAASPALRHVESLDLEGNMLGDAGLAAIAASPHLTQIRVLNLHGNRIGDDGARALSRSALMEPIRVIDLTNNMITQESQDRLHEAKARFNWRGELQLKVNSKHNLRSTGLLAAFVRRPIG